MLVISMYIKVKVEHNLLLMFALQKISLIIWEMKYICLHLRIVFYLIQPYNKQTICFDLEKKIMYYL
jgi:hypothetical protein